MILIYAEEKTPRLEYILNLIFGSILKADARLTTDISEFKKSPLPKINYSPVKLKDELYLKPHKILFSKAVVYPNFKSAWYEGEKYFFKTSDDSFLPFDPLAASFFVVTRFEEYLEKERGKYNCYPPGKSILAKYKLLKKPVVNIWARILAEKIHARYPEFAVPEPNATYLATIDIDNAWAFKNKGFFRCSGAFLKDLVSANGKNLSARIQTWMNKKPDPYDSFDYIDQVFKENKKNALFFFLLGDYKKYDKNISFRNKNFQRLIEETKKKYEVGIHPSYFSSKKKGKKNLETEISRLEAISGSRPYKSRQHFLRLFFPKTYRRLAKQGITEDYTMGYSAANGFRAGTCTPFPFFDLNKNQQTKLIVYPFQVMDVTLREYLGLNPEQAKKEIALLMDEVKKVGGIFISIWHNETLSEEGRWKGYREVFEFMNRKGFEWDNEQRR